MVCVLADNADGYDGAHGPCHKVPGPVGGFLGTSYPEGLGGTAPDSLNPAPPFTFEIWAKRDDDGSSDYLTALHHYSNAAAGGNQGGFNLYAAPENPELEGSDLTWQVYVGFGGFPLWDYLVGPPWVRGEWAYLVLTIGVDLIARFYVDGAIAATGSAPYLVGLPVEWRFGLTLYGGQARGSVAQAAVTPGARTGAEIAARYALREDGAAYVADLLADAPLAYWPLDDCCGSGFAVGAVGMG